VEIRGGLVAGDMISGRDLAESGSGGTASGGPGR
jgi:hypothetical protein